MKICYIPPKDKKPSKLHMCTLGLLTATVASELAPRSKEVIEVIRNGNDVTTITTVYGASKATEVTGAFGPKELIVIAVVGFGAYWYKTNYQKDKTVTTVPLPKKKEPEFDMSIFDRVEE